MPLKNITSLSVKKRDGSTQVATEPVVALAEGVLIRMSPVDGGFSLSVDPEQAASDPGVLTKYEALVSGGSGSLDGVDYAFSGAPYYYASLSGLRGLGNCVWLLSKMCSIWGLFEDGIHPERDSGLNPVDGALALVDVCPPCEDCAGYEELYGYLDGLRDALDGKKDAIYEYTTDVVEQNNILALYRQTILYWNNIVQQTSWRCHVEADGAEIDAAAMFTNHLDEAIPAGLELTLVFFDGPAVDGEQRIIDEVVPAYMNYSTFTSQNPPIERSGVAWSADQGNKTVEFVGLSDVDVSISDMIRVTNSSDLSVLPSDVYSVISVSVDSMVLSIPDMAAGASSGTAAIKLLLQSHIKTEDPLLVGDSIKLYVASYSENAISGSSTSAMLFLNNIKTWFPGFPNKKYIQSNKMVII